MLRILANDGLEASGVQALQEKGFEVVTDHYDVPELLEQIKGFDALIVRSATKVRKDIIDAAKGGALKLIIRAGVGVDNIDVAYAEENGFAVRNTPNASSAAVAELALGHMLTLARFIHAANVTMKQGEWNKKHYQGTELAGKTLGLIGFGRIAKSLGEKAHGLGMRVLYTNRRGPVECPPHFAYTELQELLKQSDYVSLHIPAAKEPVIGHNELALMKKTAYIINTARGASWMKPPWWRLWMLVCWPVRRWMCLWRSLQRMKQF